MNKLLFERSIGSVSSSAFARLQSTCLIYDIQPVSNPAFDSGETTAFKSDEPDSSDTQAKVEEIDSKIYAHQAGVNALAVDPFDRRLLLSGGADSTIRLWDLHYLSDRKKPHILKPTGTVSKADSAHKYGITHLSFYPFDSDAFLSSSYDHTLKLYATETLAISASFELDWIVYTHAISPIASHLLVACATQHPAIRLVDLRSGASTHSLAGHHGAVLSVSWSPTNSNILASGSTDGTTRIWDVRRSSGTLAILDMEDSVGIVGNGGHGSGVRSLDTGKSHNGAVNGVSWTEDGTYIITAGHDECVRVWDTATGANTFASFGPILKNTRLSALSLLSAPPWLTPPGQQIFFYPNEHEILMFLLHEGKLLKRLKVPGPSTAVIASRRGERNTHNRVTTLAWRGVSEGIYSGHSDGQIRVWAPGITADDVIDEDIGDENEHALEATEEVGVKRKRQVLEDIFRDLTRQKITFG